MKDKPAKSSVPVVDSHEELTGVDKMVESLRPYGSLIALGIALLFLAFIAVTWLIKSNMDRNEDQWRLLNTKIAEFSLTQNTNGLQEVAEEYPDGNAGLWALQLAGDYDLRTGIGELAEDRTAGLKQIEKARDTLQKLVDAPESAKTTMLQRRSIFSLAYAQESLGEFDAAQMLYKELLDAAPKSAFAEAARRGIERTSDPAYVVLYEKFKNWEDPLAEAPGPMLPKTPDISSDEFDFELPGTKPGGGGDFGESENTLPADDNVDPDAVTGDGSGE